MTELSAHVTRIEACAERELATLERSKQYAAPLPKVTPLASAVRAGICAAPVDSIGTVELIDAATLKPEAIKWLWPGWLARGKLHVLAGAPGTGKTTIAIHFAACVSAGKPLPSGWRPERGNVIVWSGEDDPADTLVPRLLAAGADLSRVHFVGEVTERGEKYPFDPARDVDKLAAAAASVGDVSLLIVDPLVSAVGGDSHKNAEVRRGLAPLVDLATKLKAALIGITHYSKGTQGRDPLERVTGSVAFGALARVVFGTVRQQSDDGDEKAPRKMMLARAKSNIGPDGGGYTYVFEQADLIGHPGLNASRIVWGAAVEGTARDLLADAEQDDERGKDAAGFLRDLLKQNSRPVKEVFIEASAAGYSKDAMHRAKRKIGAAAVKLGMNQGWVWRLSNHEGSAEGSEGGTQKRLPSSPSSGALPPPSDDAEVTEL